MKIYLKTACGIGKENSEDRVLIGNTIYDDSCGVADFTSGIVALADGVGGNAGGATAAQMVCQGLIGMDDLDQDDLIRLNKSIISGADECQKEMATTLSGLCFHTGPFTKMFHVGNTRIYAIQAKKYLEQLTTDDTVVNFLVKSGKLTEDEATNYQAKNEITACFGGGSESLLKVSIKTFPSTNHTHYLLTTDGVHDYLTIDEMEDILDDANGNWRIAVDQLVVRAKEEGSYDDCSAIIVDCLQ